MAGLDRLQPGLRERRQGVLREARQGHRVGPDPARARLHRLCVSADRTGPSGTDGARGAEGNAAGRAGELRGRIRLCRDSSARGPRTAPLG